MAESQLWSFMISSSFKIILINKRNKVSLPLHVFSCRGHRRRLTDDVQRFYEGMFWYVMEYFSTIGIAFNFTTQNDTTFQIIYDNLRIIPKFFSPAK